MEGGAGAMRLSTLVCGGVIGRSRGVGSSRRLSTRRGGGGVGRSRLMGSGLQHSTWLGEGEAGSWEGGIYCRLAGLRTGVGGDCWPL